MRLILLLALALTGCQQKSAPATAALEPWQPVDEGFKGCEGG